MQKRAHGEAGRLEFVDTTARIQDPSASLHSADALANGKDRQLKGTLPQRMKMIERTRALADIELSGSLECAADEALGGLDCFA